MEKLYYYDNKVFTIKELEEYTRMKELWIYKELIEKGKVKVIENMEKDFEKLRITIRDFLNHEWERMLS